LNKYFFKNPLLTTNQSINQVVHLGQGGKERKKEARTQTAFFSPKKPPQSMTTLLKLDGCRCTKYEENIFRVRFPPPRSKKKRF
jgi:hypothetical protein